MSKKSRTNSRIFKSILSYRGYSVAKECLEELELSAHRKNCTIVPHVEREEFAFNIEPIKIYSETDRRLYLPRFYGMKHFGEPENNKLSETEPNKMNKKIKCLIKLREHQKSVAIPALEQIKQSGGGILSLYTGYGKTVCALWLAMQLRLRTAIICHTTDLMLQWAERIEQFIPEAKIGIVQQNKCQIEGYDFVICSLKTLAIKDFPKTTFRNIGLTIWDEIHLMTTKLFSNAFPKLTTKYSLGLSATPFRKDKCDIIFQQFIGQILFYIKRGFNAKMMVKCLDYQNEDLQISYDKRGKIAYTTTVVSVCNDEKRTDMICKWLTDLIQEKRKILVLGEYIKHLKCIKKKMDQIILNRSNYLRLKMIVGDENSLINQHLHKNIISKIVDYFDPRELPYFTCGLYLGEMKNSARKMSQGCDIILGTYKLASVGMDIPALNTLVMASPRKEIEQSVGRILRKDTGIHPMIIDVIDNSSLFKSQGRERRKFYRQYGYSIELVKVDVDGKILSTRRAPKPRKKKKDKDGKDIEPIDPNLIDLNKFMIRKD